MDRILADENVPRKLVLSLRRKGVRVTWIATSEHRSMKDIDIIDMANEGKMVIMTTDKDFIEDAKRVRIGAGLIHIKSNLREDEIVGVAIRILDYLPSMNGKMAIILKEHTLIEDLHV